MDWAQSSVSRVPGSPWTLGTVSNGVLLPVGTSGNIQLGENMRDSPREPFRVLSLDGGGMRGLYTSVLLDILTRKFEIHRRVPRGSLDVGKGFDLIVGTSTGGIIACGLAAGIATDDFITLYRKVGPRIFRDPMPQVGIPLFMWLARHLNSAANDPTALADALRERFGDQTLGEMYEARRIALCMTSVDMKTQRSWVFNTPHDARQRDADYRLVDVCLATSAAPLYLPLVCVPNPIQRATHNAFVDGGLWANNPIIIALAEALKLAGRNRSIEIISVSTCAPPTGEPISPAMSSWGVMKWRAGSKALMASLCAQSSRYTGMAKVLAGHLNQECKILRLEGTAPSVEQARHMDLDCATEESAEVLADLASLDADRYYELACETITEASRPKGQPEDFSILHNAFHAMPDRSSHEELERSLVSPLQHTIARQSDSSELHLHRTAGGELSAQQPRPNP